jgi:hypothetical protein
MWALAGLFRIRYPDHHMPPFCLPAQYPLTDGFLIRSQRLVPKAAPL